MPEPTDGKCPGRDRGEALITPAKPCAGADHAQPWAPGSLRLSVNEVQADTAFLGPLQVVDPIDKSAKLLGALRQLKALVPYAAVFRVGVDVDQHHEHLADPFDPMRELVQFSRHVQL